MNLYWPIALAVLSDIAYQLASKSTPEAMNPFASLTLAYLVGAAASALIYLLTSHAGSLFQEWRLANWTTLVLGLAIVGLEAGSIYMFRVGWEVSVGPVLKNAILAVALVAVGYLAYREPVTFTKLAGIGACLIGLWLLNR